MRVLMISVRADHGGGPRHMELLLQNLPKAFCVFVACPDEPPYRERFGSLAVEPTYSLPHRRFNIRAALGLAAYARTHKIDVVHSHGKGAGVYGRFLSCVLGKPLLHTPHGIHVERYGRFSMWLYRAYENLTARWITHLVFVSEEERISAQVHRLWPGKRYSVISNGVNAVAGADLRRMRKATRAFLGIAEGALVVATLSRFDYQKNMQEAYQVAKALPEVTFLWVGDGDDALSLKLQSQAEGVGNLRFLGALDNPADALAAADVYLSTSRWEGLPLAVLEAMASGLPVVASDVTGHHEVIGQTGSGLLYPSGSPQTAASAIVELLNDRTQLRKIGDLGQRVQRASYSAAKMAERVTAIYGQLASKKVNR